MEESTGDSNVQTRGAGDGESKGQSSSSPVHESRLAALRRADNIVLQGGYAATSGLTSPTLLQRSNSNRTATGSPSSSRSDLSWPHSPHARSPEALDPWRTGSPKFRSSTSAQFSRAGTFPRKGPRGRLVSGLLKRGGVLCFLLLLLFFALDLWLLSHFLRPVQEKSVPSQADVVREDRPKKQSPFAWYDRLFAFAAHGLAENEFKPEPDGLWEEPTQIDTRWLPCANQRPEDHIPPPSPEDSTGYILINANGDFGQQRVAICNGVAVARMLNATLVLPKFAVSNVSGDASQFQDLYVVDYFIDHLKGDVHVVKELPVKLQSLDLVANKAVVTEDDIPREAKPSFYLERILPLLLRIRVVLFEGFGNRLAFDPVSSDIQTLRCRCNFHALRVLPELQKVGKLISERMRDQHPRWGPGDDEFHLDEQPRVRFLKNVPKYVAMNMPFDMDVAAYDSSCEKSKEQLRSYLVDSFPVLELEERLGLAELQEELGECPLTPEEGFLILPALGFKRATRVYLSGESQPGWLAKMASFKFLYPNVVTKEDILTAEELQPFRNRPFQLAALDYIACSVADLFVMTDSDDELASLVAGHRMYHTSGHAPTLRPSRHRLAALFRSNATIEWSHFQEGVCEAVSESKRVAGRPLARSIYRHPRCLECMCKHHV